MNSAVLRELGAEVRTFKTVRGAMLWLSEERNRRGRLQQPYEFGSSPRSLEARNVCNATYAALVRCMDERGLPLRLAVAGVAPRVDAETRTGKRRGND
jgi:hypothetical protein